jgi:hypothetical protein
VRHLVILLAVGWALAACSNEYHPEYHPVTVSHYSQTVAYPAPDGPPPASVVMYVPPPPPPPTQKPEWP